MLRADDVTGGPDVVLRRAQLRVHGYRAVGTEVIESINAGQMIVKIVHEELTAILGEGDRTFRYDGSPAVVMMVVTRFDGS